jgi:hypothetical protein
MRAAAIREVEAVWSDLSNVLSDEKRAEVERLDGWLDHVDRALEGGGDVAKLLDQGRRLLDMRRELLALDVVEVAQPLAPGAIPALVQAAILDDEIDAEMVRNGPPRTPPAPVPATVDYSPLDPKVIG